MKKCFHLQIYILGSKLADGMASDIHAWRRMFTLLDVYRRWKASVGGFIFVRGGREVGEGMFDNYGKTRFASCPFAP